MIVVHEEPLHEFALANGTVTKKDDLYIRRLNVLRLFDLAMVWPPCDTAHRHQV